MPSIISLIKRRKIQKKRRYSEQVSSINYIPNY